MTERSQENWIMGSYVTLSLEIHLFFLRIMKEHSLFLEAGFQRKDASYIKESEYFRIQFERLLEEAVAISDNRISEAVLDSGEIVTEFTAMAEKKTAQLTGIPINGQITAMEHHLRARRPFDETRTIRMRVRNLNRRALSLVKGLIELKEKILKNVSACRLFTANYPLLIQHIIREAKLYQSFLMELENNGTIPPQNIRETELFWNQIMMEHALFIRGLLDPSEMELIIAADGFAAQYEELLAAANKQNDRTMDALTRRTVEETIKYRDFKAAGTKGITECTIASIILPLLADHVLREANHYLRILQDIKSE